MSDHGEIKRIEADLAAIRTRIDALNDPRLDGVSARVFGALTALRPLTRAEAGVSHWSAR